MDSYYKIRNSKNPRVIAMLSGGKDSVAAVLLLKKNGIDVTAIHFIHEWGSAIPTDEAKRICSEYNIPLIIRDYTKEFCDAVNGYTAGRPCLICKKQMYKLLLGYLEGGEYGWLCIGDNSNDRTTIARIKQYISDNHPEDSLMCSGYFGSEMGMALPKEMKVIRPLIDRSAKDVERFLAEEKISIKRINSTGDKYFEYHREGCPVQFADIGVELNESLYSELKIYNDAITEFAREKDILASIHMPSTFIITIPCGYEKEAEMYLRKKGLEVDEDINSCEIKYEKCLAAVVYEINKNLLLTKAYERIFNRFIERLEILSAKIDIKHYDDFVFCKCSGSDEELSIYFDFSSGKADIRLLYNQNSKCRKETHIYENLILELFRTRKYRVGMLQ